MPLLLKDIKRDLKKYRDIGYYSTKGLYKTTNLTVSASPGVHYITYQAKVRGSTGVYLVQVRFHRVDFCPKGDQTTTLRSGKKVTFTTPHSEDCPVSLKCPCQDFQFSFEWELYKEDSCIGNWRRYKPDTEGGTIPLYDVKHPKGGTYKRLSDHPKKGGYPFRNPKGKVGYCKHINSLLEELNAKGRIILK